MKIQVEKPQSDRFRKSLIYQKLDMVLELIDRNTTMVGIARAIGCNEKSVAAFFARHNIPVPHIPTACERNHDLVLKLGREMVSAKEIARRVGTNERYIRPYLEKHGVFREYRTNYGGSRSPSWRGGRTIHKSGYVKLWMPDHPNANPNGYVWEHRYVMEQMAGRLLEPKEVVHHRNGVKDDNRPENLQLFSENSEHLKHELTGRRPKWSPEGHARIQKGVEKWRASRREQTRILKEQGALQLQ